MATIDDKVVAMSFENSKFESGVSKSLSTLDRLKQALNFSGAGKGLDQISASAGRVNLSHISNAVDSIKSKFSMLSVAAIAAFATIASQAVSAGLRVAKSFTIGPIIEGFKEYETQMTSVQTILSNTAAAGTNLKDVNAALNELNKYADQTIYNFGQMARNIGTFTAAGVDLDTSVASIKGIANLAALSGSSAEQASTAMYQLSQAISAGRVNLQDWNSVVNAGMGGTIFQRALAQTAVHMGALDKSAVKLKGSMKNVTIEGKSFRESIMAAPGKQSWLTGEVLTKTLSQLSGNLSDAQLKAEGYTAAEIKAIQTQAKQALAAATQVKTLSQLLSTTKEAIQSGWAQTWQTIFGDFGEAKTLFTGLSNAIGGFVNNSANARNKVLKDWKDLGGRTLLLQSLKQLFQDLGAVLKPVRDAFRDIFPAKTGLDLYNLTSSFIHLTDILKPSPQLIATLHSVFRGFFAVLDIGKQIISGVASMFGKLLGAVAPGAASLLGFAGNIGELLVKFSEWLRQGDKLKNFFNTLGNVLSTPITLISQLADAFADLFSGAEKLTGTGIETTIDGMNKALSPAGKFAQSASNAWNAFVNVLGSVGNRIQPVVTAVANAFRNIGNAIADALRTSNWDQVFNVIQTGLVAGIFVTIKKALGSGPLIKFTAFENITKSLSILQGSLTAMQQNIKSKTILNIAFAVGILAASIVALAMIDTKALQKSMSAITVGMGQLLAVMALINKIGISKGFYKTPVIASSMIMLAAAIDVLTLAVLGMATLDWGELARGLGGVGALLLTLSVTIKSLSRATPGLIIAGVGLTTIAAALIVLAGAVKAFSLMSWESIGKGLAGAAASLVAIGLAVRAVPPSVLLLGPGLIALSAALAGIAGSVAIFGSMKLGTLAKGIGGVAAALLAIGVAMHLMPLTLPITAAGLMLVAAALTGITASIGALGRMKVGTLAKGIGAIAAALLVLAGGLTVMVLALPGAAALALATGALVALVPVIGILGKMKIGTVAKGLGLIVAAILAIGIAGIVGAPGLILLGVGLLAVGAGLTLVSTAIALMVNSLVKLGNEGGKSLGIAIAAITAFVALLPKIVIDFIRGLVQIAAEMAKVAPQIVASLSVILQQLLQLVINSSPKLAQAAIALISAFLTVLASQAPQIIATGMKIILALLQGISNNITQITNKAVDIVLKFIAAIASRMGQIVAAGANLLVKFLQGIANTIGSVVTAGANIIVKFLQGIANNLGQIITAGGNIITKLVTGIGNVFSKVVTAGGDAIIKFIQGVGSKGADIVKAAADAAGKFIMELARGLVSLANKGADAIITFLNGVAGAIRSHSKQMWDAGFNIAWAIVEGMFQGLASLGGRLLDKALSIANDIIDALKKPLDLLSPSKVTYGIGQMIVAGLILGIDQNSAGAISAAAGMSNSIISAVQSIFGISSPSTVMMKIGQYVGEGFRNGLLSSVDDINKAFTDLRTRLQTQITATKDQVKKDQDKLDELLSAKKPRQDLISKARDALKADQDMLIRLQAGNDYLIKGTKKQHKDLIDNAKQYADYVQQMDAAKQELKDAQQALEDAKTGYTGQYSTLPAMVDSEGKPISLETYMQQLQNQATAAATYSATLDQLRALGLDDATYKKLVEEGSADQAFANQLLAGGKTAVDGLNALDARLTAESKNLATHAATNLYQAGVNAKQAIVDGLTRDMNNVKNAMTKIADEMIKALKKKLKIKSPSQEFMDIGEYMIKGLVVGLEANTTSAVTAVEEMAKDLTDTLNSIPNALDKMADMNPTITPIVDLSSVETEAQRLNKMFSNVIPITAAASFGQAASISVPAVGSGEEIPAPGSTSIKFEQNNYSPEALSPVEIYRQTRNQLSMARSAITKGG